MIRTFEIGKIRDQTFIHCFKCGSVSFNYNDVVQEYCGRCHKFHVQIAAEALAEKLRKQQNENCN